MTESGSVVAWEWGWRVREGGIIKEHENLGGDGYVYYFEVMVS